MFFYEKKPNNNEEADQLRKATPRGGTYVGEGSYYRSKLHGLGATAGGVFPVNRASLPQGNGGILFLPCASTGHPVHFKDKIVHPCFHELDPPARRMLSFSCFFFQQAIISRICVTYTRLTTMEACCDSTSLRRETAPTSIKLGFHFPNKTGG